MNTTQILGTGTRVRIKDRDFLEECHKSYIYSVVPQMVQYAGKISTISRYMGHEHYLINDTDNFAWRSGTFDIYDGKDYKKELIQLLLR